MSMKYSRICKHAFMGALALMIIVVPWSLAHAGRAVEERRPAAAKGIVEIIDLTGSVEVTAWDRPEIEVTGTVDDNIERVDLTTNGDRTIINVILHSGMKRFGDETRLLIHVPVASAVSATLVSADFKLNGIQGDVKVQTVSGDVTGSVDGNLRANTVSGNVKVTAQKARRIEIRTITGDIHLAGGDAEVEITTVSGTAQVQLGTLTRGRFKSISGDQSVEFALAPDAQLDGESVSGNIVFNFPTTPDAEFDVQSFSGDLSSCFGPPPAKSGYGSGSRLAFKSGEGHARVHVDTKSGDVKLCNKGLRDKKTAYSPIAEFPSRSWNRFYVL
jgi:DUF4097 and DUF4098 domain-containing protein YvlB